MMTLATANALTSSSIWLYLSLFVTSTFVNKYVLSVLKFTYPSIFQGWQNLVGAVFLSYMFYTGKLHISSNIARCNVLLWVPAMVLYVISIYSGSIALSQLPVSIFLSLHNTVYVFVATVRVLLYKELVKLKTYLALSMLMLSVIMVSWTDPQYSKMGYTWMTFHILSMGLGCMYEEFVHDRVSMGELDKMYMNYIFSVVVLAPSTYIFGDVLAVQDFQMWNYYNFHFGCLFSGVAGVFLGLYKIKCAEEYQEINVELLSLSAKILTSVLSWYYFPFVINLGNCFWIMVNQAAGMVLETGFHCRSPASDSSDSLEKTKTNGEHADASNTLSSLESSHDMENPA